MNQIRQPQGEKRWPARLDEISESELLIVGAFRHWLTGLRLDRGVHISIVSREFRLALGEDDGSDAFTAFAGVVRILGRSARGTVRYHAPCCPHLGADEARVVAIASACQHGRLLLAKSVAERMVDNDGAGDLLDRISDLARLMERHGCHLPERAGCGNPPSAMTGSHSRLH